MNVNFLKTRNVKSPKCNVGADAGIDIFVPEYSEELAKDILESNPYMAISEYPIEGCLIKDGRLRSTMTKSGIYVMPGDDILVPSGLHSLFPNDMMLKVDNKSGVCRKQKFIVGATIVDSSYEGEIMIHVINYAQNIVTKLDFGQKMVQLLPIKINLPEIAVSEQTVSVEDFYKNHDSERGAGGFGSTGV